MMDVLEDVVKGFIEDVRTDVKSAINAKFKPDSTQLYKTVCQQLQAALELELTTLPPYLTAYFSMREHTNITAAKLLREVFMEEMLHMCLAGNVLVAIGGQVRLGENNIPRYPCAVEFKKGNKKGRDFELSLHKFSKAAIKTFRRIELPDKFAPLGPDQYPSLGPLKAAGEEDHKLQIDASTIGDLYQDIIDNLTSLDRSYREAGRELFSTDTSNQITETYFWRGGGKPVAVTNMASAKEALSIIMEQGEGANHSRYDGDEVDLDQKDGDLAHYFKFCEIYYQRRYRHSASLAQLPIINLQLINLQLPPIGEPLAVDFDAVYPIKTNPGQSDYEHNDDLAALNKKFNQSYSLMLQQIEEAFAGNPKVLYNAIMNGMHDLTPIARTMAKIEIDPSRGAETGAPSFEWVQPVKAF
jgi:hypothetical protein